jgi:serine/threonine protein kinase
MQRNRREEEEEESRQLSKEYELGKELGAGGFSTVRLGTHLKSGEQVAVKTLRKMMDDARGSQLDADDLAMIRNEVMIVSYLFENVDHPNIVSLVDIFEEETKVHLVQELCKGGELFYRIELKLQQVHQQQQQQQQQAAQGGGGQREKDHQGNESQSNSLFSERDAAEIILQVASGLSELHAKGIIHRDMKPENLLYETTSANSGIKIADFGLSYKEGTNDPMKSRLLGSIDYIAPEVLTRRCYTKAGDMWSLGVIIYILLCGCPPFAAHNTTAKLHKIIYSDYHFHHPVWKKISNSAKHLISQLLVLDTNKRYTCEEVLRHPWTTGVCNYPQVQLTESMEGIKAFNAKRKFRAAGLACIHIHRAKVQNLHKKIANLGDSSEIITSIHFSQEELQELKKEFKEVCGTSPEEDLKTSTTNIDYECFEKIMMKRLPVVVQQHEAAAPATATTAATSTAQLQQHNQKQNHILLHRLFELFDTNGDGAVDFREFVSGLGSMQSDAGEDRVKMCFKMYDVDDSGWISKDELFEMLSSVTMKKHDMLASFNTKQMKKKRRKGGVIVTPSTGTTGTGTGNDKPSSATTAADSLQLNDSTQLHAEVLGDLFERLDVNNDGQISYDEFKDGINSDPILIDVIFGSQR